MPEQPSKKNPNRRRSSKRRRWQYYLPTMIMMVLGVICVITVSLAVIAVVQRQQNSLQNPDNSTQNTIDSTVSSSDSTTPSGDDVTKPNDQVDPDVEQLIAEADFVAAGYDYAKAIEILKGYKDYANTPALTAKVAQYEKQDKQLVTFTSHNTITHIFFHSLIVDTDRAFDGDGDSQGYHSYMTTVKEFNAILEEMYAKGYVLISPYDMAHEAADGSGFVYGDIRLPSGKKPFLMSQDDLNYYSYMIGTGSGINETPIFVDTNNDGFANKIVIKDGKPTCEYMDADGNLHYGEYDLVPCLEAFIQKHPDFSYHGARAILGMTGYEGVFGYRTKPSYEAALGSEAYAAEVAAAKEVAQCLRDNGWILASHSYGHPAYGNISAERVEKDSTKWENTVQSIIGDTDVILYPHGSDIAGAEKYTFNNAKFKALYDDGYRYFFNVDSAIYWNQLGDNYFRGGRRNLDGYRMYHNPDLVADLFDVEDVWDDARPTNAPRL